MRDYVAFFGVRLLGKTNLNFERGKPTRKKNGGAAVGRMTLVVRVSYDVN